MKGRASMNVSLDRYDRAILKALQRDASVSNLELSKKIGLSPSACLTRTKNLREQGIIRQFTTIVDEQKLGMDTMVFALLDLTPLNRETIRSFLEVVSKYPQILECYTITGPHDYLLKIVAKDVKTYYSFIVDTLMSHPAVSNVQTCVVVGIEKRTTAVPIDL